MSFEDLKDPELQEKLRACKNAEELAALAKTEGIDFSNEMLESISAGREWYEPCGEACDHSDCSTKFCQMHWS